MIDPEVMSALDSLFASDLDITARCLPEQHSPCSVLQLSIMVTHGGDATELAVMPVAVLLADVVDGRVDASLSFASWVDDPP